jgi:hypothetical protein
MHAVILEFDENSDLISADGYLIEFILALSEKMNFIPIFNPIIRIRDMKTKYKKNNQFYLGLMSANTIVDSSIFRPILFADVGFIIPSGKFYPQFMKLILPFRSNLWIAIFLLFLFAIITITIINLTFVSMKEKIYGEGVKTPITNLFSSLFGVAQNVVPTRHTPRILLMSFILFSFVIRTAYQGKLFKFLQIEPREKEVQTIKEMIEKNFTFIVPEKFYRTSQMDSLKRFVDKENDKKKPKKIVKILIISKQGTF